MYKHVVNISVLFLLFCMSGCFLKNERKETDIITIDLEKSIESETKRKSLNELIDNIHYIPVETKKDNLIGEIQKIRLYKGAFFIRDYDHLFKFSSDGKYICQIGTKGRGPNDYNILDNFFIKLDTVFIISSNKILAFDTFDGRFLSSFQFNSKYRRLYVNKTRNHFISLNYSNNYIEFYNSKGLLTDSVRYYVDEKEILDRAIIYPYYDILFGTKKSLKITTFDNDTIFEISNDFKLNPKYIIALGKYKIPGKFRPDIVPWNIFYNNSSSYFRKIVIETNDYLIIQIGGWGGMRDKLPFPLYPDKKAGLVGLGLYNKNDRTISLISKDDKNYPCFYPNFSDGENCLLSFVNAIDAISYYEENKHNYQFPKSFNEAIQNLRIDDNPIIILANLKE